MPTRIAYLGPAGTYGEQASRALAELEGLMEVSFLPCVGLRAVVECLAQAGADAAVTDKVARCWHPHRWPWLQLTRACGGVLL